MDKLRVGVLAPSEIAFRRFVPAILKSDKLEFAGVSCATEKEWGTDDSNEIIKSEFDKANNFVENFGGKVYLGYEDILSDDSIDAVYVPLPPGLHYKWGKRVLESKKHLLLEKPFSDSVEHTKELLETAKLNNLAVHENFAFVYHKQIDKILELVNDGAIGETRLIRTAFGFPYRGENDFRYHKNMGGGALLDCGGYPTRLASLLLGESAKVVCSSLCAAKGHDVDVFGSATVQNDSRLTAQISFGMDNSYKCELEIWGERGVIYTPRVFTPTAQMNTVIMLKTNEEQEIVIEPDDQFLNSALVLLDCVNDKNFREKRMTEILNQSLLMNEIRECAK